MTNSTTKRKGPIRTGAVVPSLILIAIIGVYFNLFFDSNLRRGLEYVLTYVNGAEVNIGRIATSFIGARLEIDNIQVTDKSHPARNTVQVGAIRWQMSWDALLRAKVKVDEAQILNISAFTPRAKPGYVVPPPPPSAKDNSPSALDKVQAEVLTQTQKQYNKNFLGDVASMLGGKDPKDQLSNIQTALKSDARIKQLEVELKEKQAAWDKRLKELPQGKDFQAYVDRAKALKFDINKPNELAKNIQEGEKIIKEANEKIKQIDQAQRDLKGDVNTYSQAYKDLEKMVQEDVRDLQSRLKLPSIDAKEFSQQLFMSMVEKKLGSLMKYVELARQYAPPKKTAEQKAEAKAAQVVPPKRGQGRTYRFPVTTGYPLFWLKHAAISSQMDTSEFSGNLKGEILDLTTDPAFLGKPTIINLLGDFPKQDIRGLDAKITLDHTTDVARESMIMKVAHFPTGENMLADSSDVKLGLKQAVGSSLVEATFVNQQITVTMKNVFSNIQYDLEAKNASVKEIIGGVLKDIPTVTLNAGIQGSFTNFNVNINSNLGEELSRGFQKQLQAKIDEGKAQLKKLVDEKIGANRDKLKAEMDKTLGGLTKDIDGKKAEADKSVNDAKNQASGTKGGGGNKKLEEEGKKLLKGIFGG